MDPIQRIEGLAAPLLRDNIDTDTIIPSRHITSPSREGFGVKLFAPWRYAGPDGPDGPGGPEVPDFILNREPWRHASILIAGSNFGCGSSREMAVWALWQFGFRCVIAPSFGAIFRNNCIRNGLLPVALPPDLVARWAAAAQAAPLTVVVDLVVCQVTALGINDSADDRHSFSIETTDREMLLTGLDAIDRTWQQRSAIDAFEAADRLRRPWIWA
jgi:3-isopropylmalate/(R)-2-methylmalate dehydratase small subunit